jgi:nitrite reductase/ring-hydroxylating ferredoxin subunit
MVLAKAISKPCLKASKPTKSSAVFWTQQNSTTMMLHWADFPDAPAPGTILCPVTMANGVTSLLLGDFPVLLVQDAHGTRAFVNACPHQFLPLDLRGNVLGAGGVQLICSNHDATFDARTGQGTAGFGLGCALSPLPLVQMDGMWCIKPLH